MPYVLCRASIVKILTLSTGVLLLIKYTDYKLLTNSPVPNGGSVSVKRSAPNEYYFYQPRSEGDNALGSVCPSVRPSVNALMAEGWSLPVRGFCLCVCNQEA